MSLLDDARKIAAREPDGGYYIESCCLYCDRNISGDKNHAPGCPWLNMPRIVAVLEAAERLAQKYGTVYVEDLGLDIEALVVAMQDEGR